MCQHLFGGTKESAAEEVNPVGLQQTTPCVFTKPIPLGIRRNRCPLSKYHTIVSTLAEIMSRPKHHIDF